MLSAPDGLMMTTNLTSLDNANRTKRSELAIAWSLLRCKHGICRNHVCVVFLVEDEDDVGAVYIGDITTRCGLYLVTRQYYEFSKCFSILPKVLRLPINCIEIGTPTSLSGSSVHQSVQISAFKFLEDSTHKDSS